MDFEEFYKENYEDSFGKTEPYYGIASYAFEMGERNAVKWHYIKDGDIPKDEEYKWCVSSRGVYYVARYEESFVSWTNQQHDEVCCPFAWTDIIPPSKSAE